MAEGVEIGTAYVTILPDGSRVGPEVKKSFGVVDQEADRVGRTSGKKFGGVFSSTAGKVMAGAGGLFAAVKVKDFLGESIGRASDLQEAGTKLDAIFGSASKQVQNFASAGGKALGQSKLDVLDAAATFGVFGKAAGLHGGKLAKFSTGFSKLATDLASFHNAEPGEVVEALGAALRGEAEPMRKFGVMLNDASLKAEALNLGILKPVKDEGKIKTAMARLTVAQSNYNAAIKDHGKDSIEATRAQASLGSAQNTLKKATEGTIPALTSSQKTLAAQSLIYKQTKDAQGDFTKTSSGLANQQRILRARFDDLKGEIGEKFLPIAKDVVTFLNDRAMPAFEDFIDGFTDGKGAGGKARKLFDSIRDASKDAAGYVKKIGDAFDKLPGPVKKGLLLGAGAGIVAKKTGVLGAAGSLRGATPLTPMYVKVVGGGLGSKVPPVAAAGGSAAAAEGGAGALAARAAVTGRLALARYGAGGALASAGGVRTYDLTKNNALGLKALPFTVDLMKFASRATEIKNGADAVKALDDNMAGLAMRRPGQALAEFRSTARLTHQSTEDLAKQLPVTAEALRRAGIDAKNADGKVFGLGGSVKKAADNLEFLGRQHPKVTIRSNADKVKQDVFDLKQAIEDATVTRTAHLRLAISQGGTGFGLQKREGGGPVRAGTPYIVGERRPEVFVPDQNGRIEPRVASGGVTVQIGEVRPHDYQDFMRQMQDRARRESGGGVSF